MNSIAPPCSAVLLALSALVPAAAMAEARALTMLGVDSGLQTTLTTTAGPAVDFRIGRDNFAFSNLSGAVRTAGMSGNCYSMAACAKLIFERVTFVPPAEGLADAERRGFPVRELAAHLARGSGRFTVHDHSSLFDMTNDPAFGETEAMTYVRRNMGLDGGGSPAALTGRPRAITQAMEMVSTVHYTHYMQVQAPNFLGPAVATMLRGSTAPEVTRRAVVTIKQQLQRGRTAMVGMWNPAVVFGHVVLAYRVETTPAHDDVYVYDSNVQYGTERAESLLRVARNGSSIQLFRKQPGGAPAADGMYDGDSWYARRETLCLIHLGDDAHEGDNLRALAERLIRPDLTTVYLTSVHGLLASLTEQDPAASSLRDDVRRFLLEVQTAQAAAGDPTILPSQRITTTSGAQEINRLLTAHAELAVRTVVPHALPAGLELSHPTLLLHRTDANLAFLDITLTIRRGSPVRELVRALSSSAMLAGNPALFEWLETAERLVGDLSLTVRLRTLLRKRAMPQGFATRFGLMPEIQGIHAALGDIRSAATPDHPFQVEIARPVLQQALALLLERTGALNRTLSYEFPLTSSTTRTGDANLDAVALDLVAGAEGQPGKLVFTSRLRTFTRCNPFFADRGVSWTADPLTASFQIYRLRSRNMPANRWYVHGRLDGQLAASDGLGNLATGTLADLVTAAFPALRGRLNAFITEQLAGVARFVDGLQVRDLAVGVTTLSAQTGEAVVDLERLGQGAFCTPFPVEVRQVRVLADRLVLGGAPR